MRVSNDLAAMCNSRRMNRYRKRYLPRAAPAIGGGGEGVRREAREKNQQPFTHARSNGTFAQAVQWGLKIDLSNPVLDPNSIESSKMLFVIRNKDEVVSDGGRADEEIEIVNNASRFLKPCLLARVNIEARKNW